MENATKAILIAASVIITMTIITLGYTVFRSAQNTAAVSAKKINDANRLIENEYTMYDNEKVSGNDVVSAIDKILSAGDYVEISVTTKTGGTTVYNALSGAYSSIKDAEDIDKPATYINPTATFSGKISRDINGRIAKISFTQQ